MFLLNSLLFLTLSLFFFTILMHASKTYLILQVFQFFHSFSSSKLNLFSSCDECWQTDCPSFSRPSAFCSNISLITEKSDHGQGTFVLKSKVTADEGDHGWVVIMDRGSLLWKRVGRQIKWRWTGCDHGLKVTMVRSRCTLKCAEWNAQTLKKSTSVS
jgi:hypothetical protein